MREQANRPPPVCLDTTITILNPHYRAETKFRLFQELTFSPRHRKLLKALEEAKANERFNTPNPVCSG